jgi:hypothetical protein
MYYSLTIISLIEVVLVLVPALVGIAYVTIAERKTMASMQRRLGPNQIGYLGLLQAFADALKLLLKEYVAPTQANIVLFFLGPVITLIFALLGYAVIPYGPGLTVNDFSLGIYYMLAVSSLATYGILLAGFFLPVFNLHTNTNNTQDYLSHKSKSKFVLNFHIKISKYPNLSRCFIHTNQHHNNNNNSNMNSEEYIQEIFKDRVAPVIPFDRNLIKDSCFNYTDKILKAKFLKE